MAWRQLLTCGTYELLPPLASVSIAAEPDELPFRLWRKESLGGRTAGGARELEPGCATAGALGDPEAPEGFRLGWAGGGGDATAA